MEFATDKPIFRQVADYCVANIRAGNWPSEQRIPSTKELAIELAVNNRTVMKAYDGLSDAGVIYQRRGLGYYVAPDALDHIRKMYRDSFQTNSIPALRREMELAGITPEELIKLLNVSDDLIDSHSAL